MVMTLHVLPGTYAVLALGWPGKGSTSTGQGRGPWKCERDPLFWQVVDLL